MTATLFHNSDAITATNIEKETLPKSLSSAEKKALLEFKDGLIKRLNSEVLELRLFGSRARGEGHEESDLDVAVLVRDENKHGLRRDIYDMAAEIYLESEINIAPLVMSNERFEWFKSIERGIALEIERDGIRV